MQSSAGNSIHLEAPLQLLLFVDKRPSFEEQVRRIHACLNTLKTEYPFELKVIDVGEQPYLAEHFRVIATPTLIKIHPEPRQTLAGSNIITLLETWWPRWQRSIDDSLMTLESVPLEPAPAQNGSEPPVNGSSGSIAQATELLQLSDEIFRLKRENEALEEQLQFKDKIIAMLAHDLRNPLTAASIAIETLEMGLESKDGQPPRLAPTLMRQVLKHARTQTRTIDRMITDILQAARGTSGELQIHPQSIDIGVLCLEVLSSLDEQFQAKAQQVETDIPSDLPRVYADRERVRQVVINLLDNAIKYTPQGGKIEISILHRTTQKIQVSVTDNGPGIPEENLERIFEDRFRLQRDETKSGYGIGLSLCQRIIRAHYGQIWVDSKLSQGSCFHFTLPVYR